MDFKNLCQKIDVEGIRAKIPPMPAMPHIKLPKSLPKLKSRKIFKSSRENVSSVSPKHSQQHLQPPLRATPHSTFIDHSPTRISTISSLMDQGVGGGHRNLSTYRSAGSIDDYYLSPRSYRSRHNSGPISPIRVPIEQPHAAAASSSSAANTNTKLTLTEKFQKGYKDISEFRLKHIFFKKTVLRKDDIQVDYYVRRFDEDRAHEQQEQQRRDHDIAENYHFNFKLSRQNTGKSDSISSHESFGTKEKSKIKDRVASPFGGRSVSAQSGDESGMETSPPERKLGTAANRFAKVRSAPVQQTLSGEIHKNEPMPFKSASIVSDTEAQQEAVSKAKAGYKERMRSLKKYITPPEETGEESAAEASNTGAAKVLSKIRGLGRAGNNDNETGAERKRKAPLTPQQSEEHDESHSAGDNALNTIKQNIKRFQKSFKRSQPPAVTDSEDEETDKETNMAMRVEKLKAGIRSKFRSHESSTNNLDSTSPRKDAIMNKIQSWKKSFKKKPSEASHQSGEETSPEKQEKRSGTLMKKLKHIRSRKSVNNSTDDLDDSDDEEGHAAAGKAMDSKESRSSKLEEKFEQARQRTMKKVNEKMQQMKLFHKSHEQVEERDERKTGEDNEELDKQHESASVANVPAIISRRSLQDVAEFTKENREMEHQQYISTQRARWTSRPPLSESMDSEDTDAEFPRVLIHQDNSDLYEQTLIIAVTRPAPSPRTITKISEIPAVEKPMAKAKEAPMTPVTKPVEWIPNKEIISSFRGMTPPNKREAAILPPPTRRHTRKNSVDSNSDSDSWIPENVRHRRASASALNNINENERPWKVHTMYSSERLYKTKSIDIFKANEQKGGVLTAFEDFEDELKNAPVVRITRRNVDSFENGSSQDYDDATDDDNSSRITKILVESTKMHNERSRSQTPKVGDTEHSIKYEINQKQQIGNSRESLIDNFDESEELESDEEDDRPPSAAPSPPPPFSPPLPPLPQRQPSIRISKSAADLIAPGLPATPPPVPATIRLTSAVSQTNPSFNQTTPPLNQTTVPLAKTVEPELDASHLPKIPERTTSLRHVSKPLVKTSSLRLAYSEQVKPADVGKVNKLISRFEQPPSKVRERPLIISRRVLQDDDDDSDEYSDDDEELEQTINKVIAAVSVNIREEYSNANVNLMHDPQATPTNKPKRTKPDAEKHVKSTHVDHSIRKEANVFKHDRIVPTLVTTIDEENNAQVTPSRVEAKPPPVNTSKAALSLDRTNSNCSHPSSEYGSPLEYPSSLMGSTETTPTLERREVDIRYTGRRGRSMNRENDNYYSFDSDEENSYYSISPSGSSRYIVEI